MAQNPPSSPILLGPVTAPAAQMPNSSPPPPPTLSASSTVTSNIVRDRKQFEYPWKYEGYKALSAWMASEDDFFILRRFQDLNARTILWMQDRIAQLEEKLEEMDKFVEDSPPDYNFKNSSFRFDEQKFPPRHAIMAELSTLLHHYNQFIETYSKVRARPRANERQIDNVKNWLKRKAIDEEERSFISKTADLISINHRLRPPLGRWLESIQRLHTLAFFRAKPDPNLHQSSATTVYTSNARFELLTNIGIISGGLVMLLAPLWWLEYENDSKKKLGIMSGFICLFIFLMSTATVNRPFEAVAATAAYAAVLMVFMQIEGKGGAS